MSKNSTTAQVNVYDLAIKTPLHKTAKLSRELGNTVYLKREDLQPVHSFKIRGAYYKIASLNEEERSRGVIAASAGNHAQGVALSARELGIPATIVMPVTTPSIKVDAVKGYGAEVVLAGDNYSEAYEHCQQLIESSGKIFIHPYDDPLVIAGQGTIGQEIIDELPTTSHVFVPVGGGGLIAGVAQAIKHVNPSIKIIGVEPEDSNAMQASLAAEHRVTLPHVGLFADGVAVKQVGNLTFDLVQKHVDEVITVSTDEICAGIKAGFEETRSILEPAGALSIAGMQKYVAQHGTWNQQLVAICSGANMPFERLQFVAERTLLGSKKEALFVVTLPEVPGALKKFCFEVVNGHNITEFNYRLNEREQARIFVGITVRDEEDKQAFTAKMSRHKYAYTDVSHDDIAKEHIRHMVGGTSDKALHEQLYEIQFPERPRALADFLNALGERWNISLFHYRGVGGDVGRVLIGFEADNRTELERVLKSIGYEFVRADSPAAKLLL